MFVYTYFFIYIGQLRYVLRLTVSVCGDFYRVAVNGRMNIVKFMNDYVLLVVILP